jgi:hypothetical protein
MKTRTGKEWAAMYESQWRVPYANHPKEVRQKLVRGCQGKAIYDNPQEALKVMSTLKPIPGKVLNQYVCPLCKGIHIGNRTGGWRGELGTLWMKIKPFPFEVNAWLDAVARDRS